MENIKVQISDYKPGQFDAWSAMTQSLYPEMDKEELKEDLLRLEKDPRYRTFIAQMEENIIGFVTLSVRTDYVEGAKSSPVGYIEAIYVRSRYRKSGIAKQLFEKGQIWLKENNCLEVGSDTWLWNTAAQDFHEKLGFKKEDVLVHYIKKID